MECGTCEVNNNCELQDVANDLGISDHRYNVPKQHKGIPRDTSHDYMRTVSYTHLTLPTT